MNTNFCTLLPRIMVLFLIAASPGLSNAQQAPKKTEASLAAVSTAEPIRLSEAHQKAVNRRRRIAVNFDVGYPANLFGIDVNEWVDFRFAYADQPGSQIDSLWWCLDEGNLAYYPSDVLPVTQCPQMRKWLDNDIDIMKVIVDECHKRGIECFHTHRLNGYDGEWDLAGTLVRPYAHPLKDKHPEWLIDGRWGPGALWDFAYEGVRVFKVATLRELAENYDLDGIDINFARHPPCLAPGRQWENRDAMTDFVRRVRIALQEVAAERGRPILLSVQVPSTVAGCHFDGYDVETWVRQNLVDIFVVGTHSFDVEIQEFKRITAGKNIKIYPCMDDHHHEPSGYRSPPIEVERGYAANWWHQGADAMFTFNWANASLEASKAIGFPERPNAHGQAYCEIGDPEALRLKNKTFVVTRRFGGGFATWAGGKKWDFYHNMNIEAPLPMPLKAGSMPAILRVYVADDLAAAADHVENGELRVHLSGADAGDELQVKLNGVRQPVGTVDGDRWCRFQPDPRHLAVGPNLVYLHLGAQAAAESPPVMIEKLEVQVTYRDGDRP